MGVLTQLLCLLLSCLPGEEGSAGDTPEMVGVLSSCLCGSLTLVSPRLRDPGALRLGEQGSQNLLAGKWSGTK